MRVVAAIVVLLAAPAAEAQCTHFDVMPGAGVDLVVVSDLGRRLAASGLAASGDLDDCPVRLGAEGQDVVVQVELEDRIVTRTFAREPPREAAWSIALLLEELAGRERSAGERPGSPPEIIPAVMMPISAPDLSPTPRVERRVRPPPPRRPSIALGPRLVGALRGVGEPAALALRVAVPVWSRLDVVAAIDAYLPTEREGGVLEPNPAFEPSCREDPETEEEECPEKEYVVVGRRISFWSLQPAVGASWELLRGTLSATAEALVLARWVSVDPDPGPEKLSVIRSAGFCVGGRAEYRLDSRLGVGLAIAGRFLPAQNLTNSEDLETAPWEVGGGLDVVIHL